MDMTIGEPEIVELFVFLNTHRLPLVMASKCVGIGCTAILHTAESPAALALLRQGKSEAREKLPGLENAIY